MFHLNIVLIEKTSLSMKKTPKSVKHCVRTAASSLTLLRISPTSHENAVQYLITTSEKVTVETSETI